MELDRRNFLKVAGTSAAFAIAGSAATAMAAEPPAEGDAPAEGEGDAPAEGEGGPSMPSAETEDDDTNWREAPAEVTDFAQTIDCDVVVCGHGFAGTCATRELAEEGYKVILIERQDEDTYMAVGNEFASLNSDAVLAAGADEIDPVEFYQNFMKITSNVPNPTLVMKFAQNSAENTNWYLDKLTADDLATMTSAFLPKTEHQLAELSGIKFWASVCSFYGECNETKILTYNLEEAQDAGAEIMWGTEAYYAIMEDGKVAGFVAKQGEDYIKFNCKAVVSACGGFGGNKQMMNDLISDMYSALADGEELSDMSTLNNGAGVKLLYWAGAHLETTPIAGMNMKGLSVPGKMNVLPQAVWVDENGKRFCNEFYPVAEQRGYQNIFQTRKTKYGIIDDNFTTYRQYTLPQHAGFEATESNIQSLRDSMDKAYATFKGTGEEESTESDGMGMGPMTGVDYIADDTLEGLADQLGLTDEAKENFLQQIADWNQYCADGVDQQFGRDPQVLFPIDTPPYYACTFDPVLGETMTTMGGILTDGDQNAIDKNYEPIPGLYATGNDCGRRFGYEYVTPIPGCSLAFAIVLGRECGKSVGKYLAANK